MAQLTKQDAELKAVKKRLAAVEKAGTSDAVAQLQSDVNELEWRSRKQNLEIYGIQETENENLLSKVNEVATKLGVPTLQANEVVSMHRLPAKPGKERGTIVRFVKQETRDKWLGNRKKLTTPGSKMYITENLTRYNRMLLSAAKNWAKANDYQFVWHNSGRVFIRYRNGEPKHVIKCEDDLLAFTSS